MNGEREVDAFYSTAYMMSKEEVYEYFEHYVPIEEFDQWTANSNYIADQIEIYDIAKPQFIPEIKVQDFPISKAEELVKPHVLHSLRDNRIHYTLHINELVTDAVMESVLQPHKPKPFKDFL